MRVPGRCNQSSYLKVASPSPAKAAKVYVMHALPHSPPPASPAPRPHASRAPRPPVARSESGRGVKPGSPGRRWAERLPWFCSLAREEKERTVGIGLAAPGRDLSSSGPSAGGGEGAARETGGRAGSAGAVAAPRDVC